MSFSFIGKASTIDKDFYFKELKIKHLKVIYKSLIGEDLQPEIIFYNLNLILNDLIEDKSFHDVSYLSYFILLFELRSNSIGNIIFTQPNENSNTKIEINISKFVNIIREINLANLLQEDSIDQITVKYKLPSIHNLLLFENAKTINDIYLYFIEEIIINNKKILNSSISSEEKNTILESIPAKITSLIFKRVQNILQELNKINLLSNTYGLTDKFLPINCNIQNLCGIIKLLFGNQLLSLYENIFALCKLGNFSSEYIEECTPGEYLLYVKRLEALNKQQEQQNTPSTDFDPMQQV